MPDGDGRDPGGGQAGAAGPPPLIRVTRQVRNLGERAIGRLEDERTCWAVLAVAMLVYAVLAMWLTRGTTLYVDEASLFAGDHWLRPEALLAPLNGNLALLSRLVYAVGFKLVGADFVVFRLTLVVGAALAVGLLFTLLKRRVGGPAALAAALLVLFLGSAWEVLYTVAGISNVYCVAAALGALLALERGDRRGDAWACALLIVSVSAYTLGVAFAVGAAVWFGLRSERPRRWWVPAIPLGLFVAWLVWVRAYYVPEHGEVQTLRLSNALVVPNAIANEAASLAGAIAGLNYDFGIPNTTGPLTTASPYGALIAVAAVAALVLRLRRGDVSPFLWTSLAVLLAFWAAIGLSFGPGRTPEVIRYVYGGSIVALLIAAEALRRVRPSRTVLLAVFAIVAIAMTTNLARLRDGNRFYRDYSITLRAQLTSLEVARGHVPASFIPPTGPAHFDFLTAGPYLSAVDRIGSPAFSLDQLARQTETRRHEADSTLVSALEIKTAAPRSGEGKRNCRSVTAPAGTPVNILVGPPGILLRSPVPAKVAVRRFATTSTVRVGTLRPDRPAVLRIPEDRSASPWHVTVMPAVRPVTACQLQPPADS